MCLQVHSTSDALAAELSDFHPAKLCQSSFVFQTYGLWPASRMTPENSAGGFRERLDDFKERLDDFEERLDDS